MTTRTKGIIGISFLGLLVVIIITVAAFSGGILAVRIGP